MSPWEKKQLDKFWAVFAPWNYKPHRPGQPQRRKRFAPSVHHRLSASAEGRCEYCSTPLIGCPNDLDEYTVDHVEALASGGGHGDDNLVAACRSCNSRKKHRPAAYLLGSAA